MGKVKDLQEPDAYRGYCRAGDFPEESVRVGEGLVVCLMEIS